MQNSAEHGLRGGLRWLTLVAGGSLDEWTASV